MRSSHTVTPSAQKLSFTKDFYGRGKGRPTFVAVVKKPMANRSRIQRRRGGGGDYGCGWRSSPLFHGRRPPGCIQANPHGTSSQLNITKLRIVLRRHRNIKYHKFQRLLQRRKAKVQQLRISTQTLSMLTLLVTIVGGGGPGHLEGNCKNPKMCFHM